MSTPILEVDKLVKQYRHGPVGAVAFSLEAEFMIDRPAVVGVMGPNGSGKTTLFELITGSNRPTAGTVRCLGQNIHNVRYGERDRLAIHYHQSYQVRRFKRIRPAFLMERAASDYPMIHLFDEPQFNTQDGYIGFMLEFFAKLRAEGRLVFVCIHPNEPFHLEIMREICEQFIFVRDGRLTRAADWHALTAMEPVQAYLGDLLDAAA